MTTRTTKQSSILVEKTVKQINQLTKGLCDEEKLEVINMVCNQNEINANHIIAVLDLKTIL